ncbi:MAG: ATP phosphoribosyltransferase [bacterium]
MKSDCQASIAPERTASRTGADLRLALPKGRMLEGVLSLLAGAGIRVRQAERDYRALFSLPGWEVKLLKPQNIVEMLDSGTRDLGFAGADWVAELGADLVEVLDTGLDPVSLVAAAPAAILEDGALPVRPLVVATEYVRLGSRWTETLSLPARLVRSYGATEVFPPEDADCIIDNSATGSTLRANGLVIVQELLKSSTRLYASRCAWADPVRRGRIEELAMLLSAVLEARNRVMLEVNIPADRVAELVAILPCMREPTLSPLSGQGGFAVKAAVPRCELPLVIPRIRRCGGTDIVVSEPSQILP